MLLKSTPLVEKVFFVLAFKTACTLTRTGRVETGVHVFEVTLEDVPTKNITVTYAGGATEGRGLSSAPLCRVELKFSVEGEKRPLDGQKATESFAGGGETVCLCVSVLPPVLGCQAGRSLPAFLPPTPPHRSVLHATVGQNFQLRAAARAHHAQ